MGLILRIQGAVYFEATIHYFLHYCKNSLTGFIDKINFNIAGAPDMLNIKCLPVNGYTDGLSGFVMKQHVAVILSKPVYG